VGSTANVRAPVIVRTVPTTVYRSGESWCTMVTFPDCAAMRFSYAASANLPAPVPSGSGDRTWARLTQENGLSCR